MRVTKRILVSAAVLFFASVVFLWWALRTGRAVEYLRTEIVTQAKAFCGVNLAFESLKLDSIPPIVSLSGVVVDDATGGARFASVDQAIVELEVLPLLYGRIQIDRAALLAPTAELSFREDGSIANLPVCLRPDPTVKKTVPIVLGVRELRVERARLAVNVPGKLDADVASIDITLKPGATGGADLVVAVDGSTLAFAKASVPVPRVRLLAHISGPLTNPRAISVESLDIEAAHAKAHLTGSVDLIGPVYEAKIALSAPLGSMPELFPDLPPMKGTVSIEGAFAGTLTEPRAVAKLILVGAGVDDMSFADRVEVDVNANLARVEVTGIDVKLGEGRVRGDAKLTLGDKPMVEADLKIDRLPFGRLMACLGVQGAWVDWSATGKVSAGGTLQPFAIGGDVSVELERFRVWDRGWDRPEVRGKNSAQYLMLGFPMASVEGNWTADPDGFWIRDATLRRGTSTGTATARVNIEDADGIMVDAVLEPMDLADLGPVNGVNILGKGRVDVHLSGPRSNILGLGKLNLKGVNIAEVPLGDATSSIEWRDTTVKLPDLSATLLKTHYKADATLDFVPSFQLTAHGRIDDGRLEDILVPLAFVPDEWGNPTGAMVAAFDVKGPIKQLDGTVAGTLTQMTLVDETIDRGKIEMHFDKGRLVFDQIDLFKNGATISGQAMVDPNTLELSASLRSTGYTLQRIDALRGGITELDAPLGIALDLGGTTQVLTGTVTADFGTGRAGNLEMAPGRLVGHFHGRSLDVRGKLVGGVLGVKSTIGLVKGMPYTATLDLEKYDVPHMIGELGGEPSWRGELSGTAEVEGSLTRWKDSSGTLNVESGRFDMGEKLAIEMVGGAKMGLAARSLTAKRVSLQGPSLRGMAAGQLGAKTDLRIQGRLDLSLLPGFFPQIETSGGILTVDAVMRGEGETLDLLGTGRIERAMLEWRGLPSRLTGGTAQLTFSKAAVLIERAEGRYADGNVTASGEIGLVRMVPTTVRLETQVEGIRPRFTFPKLDLTGTLTGPLVMEGKFDKLTLGGRLAVSRAVMRPKIDPRALIADPSQRLAPSVYDPDKEVMTFDVGLIVSASDPLKVKDETTDVDLYGDLAMTGTNQRFGLMGALAVSRGRVGFIGREYTFASGTIEFRDRYAFAPRFDVELTARACDAQITLALVGTFDSIDTTYSSKPEMEDTNIVSCLVRGIRVRDLENISGDSRGSTAASFAGEALWRLSGVDQEVRKVLPVDQIEVTTEYSSRDRVYEPRILVAKELGDGKFRLEYSSSLVKNDEQRAAVRYRITPALTLQYTWASSDDITVGDHGVDLKYRWEW